MIHTRAAKISTIGILALALFLFAGCGNKQVNNDNADKTIPVTVSQAKKENISAKTVITGKVTPLSEVVIVPKAGGKVAQVPVDVSSRVAKGSLLVKLDTTDQEISLNGARLSHNQAVLNYNNAKANYERSQSLFSQGAISKKDLELSELSYKTSGDLAAGAQNQIATIMNQISNATITSPIDGEVAIRSIDPGEMAGPTQPVMTVVNIDRVYVEGTVAESDVSLVKEGQAVSVKVEATGGTFEGTVKTLSPVASPQTKGYPIKVEISNKDRKLKPGMFAEIQLVTKGKKGALVVPKEALVTRGSDKILYVVKNGVVEERTVETGIEAEDKIEIVKGLAEGEQFVTEGQQSLFDKAKVTVRTGETGS
ncbi:MAG: efflux RND transporter periplasmic adaptor subunit [Firmicutes bacterium]|nr:efflux RND transporter periplasmic adaptor subunit [Bacillota bacterium]